MRALAWTIPLLLLATACTPVDADDAADDTDEETVDVRVGGGPDVESTLLARTMTAMLTAEGLSAEMVPFSDARDARQALELGAIDARPAYTGEDWLEDLGRADPPGDVRESFVEVRDHDGEDDIVWLPPRFDDGTDTPPANATFAFVVGGPPSVDAELTTVSQLATRLSERPDATLCVDEEFASRSDGLRAVLIAYSVRSDQPVLAAAPDEVVGGVGSGECIAGLTTATDGTAWQAGLRPLTDDLEVFPAFVVLPQVRRAAVDGTPGLRRALAPMASELSTELLGSWNARIVAGEPIDDVAEEGAQTLVELAGRDAESLEDG
jgi:osmoprotectant transport system substrate-binding protein